MILPGLKRELSIILAISVLQKTLIRTNIKVEIVIVFLLTARKYCQLLSSGGCNAGGIDGEVMRTEIRKVREVGQNVR